MPVGSCVSEECLGNGVSFGSQKAHSRFSFRAGRLRGAHACQLRAGHRAGGAVPTEEDALLLPPRIDQVLCECRNPRPGDTTQYAPRLSAVLLSPPWLW